MTVRYNVMGYLIGEGFRNVLKNKKSTGAALIIMCMAMLMFGLFFILGENINYIMDQVESEQGIQVYLEIGTTAEEEKEIETKIRAIEGVNTVEFITGEEGYNEMLSSLQEYSAILGELDKFMPDSYIVTLTDLSLNDSVQEQINQIEKVDSIESSNKTINMLMNITKGIRFVTLAILAILVIISIFIITNTIKLTVHARRKEISIMKYVGATNGFIRWPFIVEGIIIGLVAALITIFIVGLLYNVATNNLIQSNTFAELNVKLYTFADIFNLLLTTYILLGAGIGIVRKLNINEKIFRGIKAIGGNFMTKKIIGAILVILILSISVLSYAATADEIKAQQKDLKDKINQAEDRIDDIEGEVDSALGEISKLDAEISEKQDAISNLNYELNILNGEIANLETQLKEEETKYNEQYESLKARMVAQYKMGKVSYLDVLLNSKSLSDFISRYYVIEKVAEYDTKLLDQIEKQKIAVETSKKTVEKKQSEVSEKQSKLKVEEITLTNKRTNKNKMIAQLNDEQKKLQQEIDADNAALEKTENELREIARKAAMAASAGGHVYSGGKLEWPAPDYTRISSGFGYRGSAATGGVGTAYHRGVDLASAKGSRVLAAEAGTVIKTNMSCTHNYGSKCGCGGTLGNYIMISHGGGLVTLYGHCTSVDVSVGQNVSRGQQIGTVGSTGNSTGYHLHFATLANGSYVNPMGYFN